MTSTTGTQLTAAQWRLEPIAKRVLVIGVVVAAGLGLADLLGIGAAIAEAGLPPRSPTGPGPE